jgi:hypothetical protein
MPLFEPGQSGNPGGRPAGSRNRKTVAIEQTLADAAETLVTRAIELANGGDTTLIRLCLGHLRQPRQDRHVRFALPDMNTPADALNAMAAITKAVAAGQLMPGEAAQLSHLVVNHARAFELAGLEQPVRRPEQARETS